MLAAAAGHDMLADALTRVPLVRMPPVIVNYGSAHGTHTLAPIGQAIGTLRDRIGPGAPIAVIHADQPETDFSHLFTLLRDHPDAQMQTDPEVYPFAVGRSLFGPLLSPDTATIGWSSFAVHWLSALPKGPIGHVWGDMAAPAMRRAFAQRSAEDWQAFLLHRARELVPGGCLVVVQPITQGNGEPNLRVLMGWLQRELEDMAADGMIGATEFSGMTIPVHDRTAQDILSAFTEGRFRSLTILAEETRDLPDPYWAAYAGTSDVQALSAGYISFVQTAFMPSLLRALDPGRTDAFARAFSGRLLAGLRQRVLEAPQALASPLATHALLLQKDL
ncbi:hypothetical protein GCM10007301_46620 [Azorhizobium oxalatiphilum]|uniref:SAM dependent carboxyl methyltransferase n=1 Tax=Azorhizobium oxalatiphilum TaxID=980631 RepID=A0A917CBC4_9HYPH|nr:hypothetical protein [Azorhizobium oxalatiphilum]GGF81167.1 hypothetical protein GCM10007301_46620 [Azorhizobium oxalatiphilum]